MAKKGIERRLIIAFIVSTEFLKQVRELYSARFFESSMAKRLATWCVEHFDKYEVAPGKHIGDIYFEKLKKGLPKEVAEEIEQDILPDLNEQFLEEGVNVPYLVDEARKYFTEQHLQLIKSQVEGLLDKGEVDEAQAVMINYKPLTKDIGQAINMSNPQIRERIAAAFAEAQEPLIKFPKQLGIFWNDAFTRGAFVALMASEKRGKTFWLAEFAKRAVQQRRKVAFFQAGDMTEAQQLRRFGINLAKKSDKQKYCGEQFQPVRDCIHNQRNTCDRKERECEFGVFEHLHEKQVRNEVGIDELIEAWKENQDYSPCYNCGDYENHKWGVPWLERVIVDKPLDVAEATEVIEEFFVKNKREIMLSTHANGTLSVGQIESWLDVWEKQQDFIPDVIIVDYADLLVVDKVKEFRHQQNEIWKALRSLSQKKQALVITATQADADSYKRDLLTLSNYSEDKRKYAHVTAMYGLNQDHLDREKKIGIMRINELIKREGDFSNSNVVFVLQNLKRGQPFLASYF